MTPFLSRFRGLLEESNKSQKEICDDLGIRNQKLSNWKTGYSAPNFDDIVMLAKYFEVSTDYLLGLEDDIGIKKYSTPAKKDVELSRDGKELLDIFNALEPMYQAQILEYARYTADRRGIKRKKA